MGFQSSKVAYEQFEIVYTVKLWQQIYDKFMTNIYKFLFCQQIYDKYLFCKQ